MIWICPVQTAHQVQHFRVYARTCACPEKAALMYFGRISLEYVLGMIDFPQIVQTMNRQVICAELSASSRFYVYRNNAV